jgi:hypothetical protein
VRRTTRSKKVVGHHGGIPNSLNGCHLVHNKSIQLLRLRNGVEAVAAEPPVLSVRRSRVSGSSASATRRFRARPDLLLLSPLSSKPIVVPRQGRTREFHPAAESPPSSQRRLQGRLSQL